MSAGYIGKMLWVDLTTLTMKEEALDEKIARQYLGGYGLGARILYEKMKPGVDPLGPENILGFVSGLFTGTQALGGSRYAVVGKSPLTGGWGDANSGGNFGPFMRFAGYDAVFFTGASLKPVYLLIDNGKAELREALHIWGKDTHDTEDMLKEEVGSDAEITCIGPAGEKLSLISAVVNNRGRAAGRSGLGAVMGSKRLKAIVARGKIKVPVNDEKALAEMRKTMLAALTGPKEFFSNFGTPGITIGSSNSGDSPVKNWSGAGVVDFQQVENLGSEKVDAYKDKKYGCYRCPVACGGRMKAVEKKHKVDTGSHRPEYETLSMFGSNLLNDNVESIIKVNDICNRAGLDTISTGAVIGMAIECYENGLIRKENTGGIELTWGNDEAIVAMTELLANREGFGEILADGVKVAAERIGGGAEKYAMHIGGQEYPAHDPRLGKDFATFYRMDATPGRHTRGGGNNPPGLPLPEIDPDSYSGRAEFSRITSNFNHIVDCVGMCLFVYGTYPDVKLVADFINVLTGWDTDLDELIQTGERIADIRHLFNLREGINPLKIWAPDRVLGKPPLKEGPNAGVTIDEETLDREYCEVMGWDVHTTEISTEKLKELDLFDLVKK